MTRWILVLVALLSLVAPVCASKRCETTCRDIGNGTVTCETVCF